MNPPQERREFQRLRIDEPVSAAFSSVPVTLVEIGVLGARIEHDSELPSDRGDLRFRFDGEEVALDCRIMRTTRGGTKFESGIRFINALDESGDRLREMLRVLVTSALEMLRAQPKAATVGEAIDFDKTMRTRQTAFVSYRLEEGIWQKRRLFLPEQPPSGFTISRVDEGEDIDRLCRIYQGSDEEGRRLIRMFAELSVSSALQIPPNG